jgi:hypothetical protein
MPVTAWQGNQIGRVFAQWVAVCLWMLHENYKSSPHFGRLYSADKFMLLSRQKMGWATFWANFSQTHLVILVAATSTHRYIPPIFVGTEIEGSKKSFDCEKVEAVSRYNQFMFIISIETVIKWPSYP